MTDYTRPERLDTWIDGSLITIDLEAIWAETFAKWETLVDTETATQIATATSDILRRAAIFDQDEADHAHERILGA